LPASLAPSCAVHARAHCTWANNNAPVSNTISLAQNMPFPSSKNIMDDPEWGGLRISLA
jgi:hypothetical protein